MFNTQKIYIFFSELFCNAWLGSIHWRDRLVHREASSRSGQAT